MKYTISLLIFFISFSTKSQSQLSGFIKESSSGEAIVGVNVQILNSKLSTHTNTYGFYSIKISNDKNIEVKISTVGYKTVVKQISLNENTVINFELEIDLRELDEVKIVASDILENDKVQMSSIILTAAEIKQMPLILGEKDPMKALQLLPGVQQGSEGSSNIYVRGGGADQNLILLDEGIVYNANHLFGFFSTFNADPIKQVELYKGGFPARYGGRLSSVIDVKMREGNKKEFHGEGGIGLISSRLTLEGPIKKNTSSFLLSVRRTYADALITPFLPKSEKVGYYFYDVNSKINIDLNTKNSIFLSIYTGKDLFYTKDFVARRGGHLTNRIGIDWGNITGTLRWNKVFNQKLFSNTSIIYTKYNFGLSDYTKRDYVEPVSINDLRLISSVRDYTIKVDFDYFPWKNGQIRMGVIHTLHQFSPRSITYISNQLSNSSFENKVSRITNNEGALYLENETKSKYFSSNLGLRLSYYGFEKQLKTTFEPRILLNFSIRNQQSIKVSYSRMAQYIHLLSNTAVGLPTDLWIPSNDIIKPSYADQIAIGFVKDLNKGFSFSVESYYKLLKNIIQYKDGANFLSLSEGATKTPFVWEDNVTQGHGWSYGYEFFIQKKVGKFTGFTGYTLSWAIRQFDELNQGKTFYSPQDRRHDLETSLNYKLSKKIRLSINALYSTGNALTVPIGLSFREDRGSTYLFEYGQQNTFRAEPYHRIDVGLQLYKKKKWGERYWDFSVYNMYNRKNPYSYIAKPTYTPSSKTVVLNIQRNWLIPILPAFSYNFKF